jgi:hypothetical protein
MSEPSDYSDLSLLDGIPTNHTLYSAETLEQFVSILEHDDGLFKKHISNVLRLPAHPVPLKGNKALLYYMGNNESLLHIKFFRRIYKNYTKDGPYGNKEYVTKDIEPEPVSLPSTPLNDSDTDKAHSLT